MSRGKALGRRQIRPRPCWLPHARRPATWIRLQPCTARIQLPLWEMRGDAPLTRGVEMTPEPPGSTHPEPPGSTHPKPPVNALQAGNRKRPRRTGLFICGKHNTSHHVPGTGVNARHPHLSLERETTSAAGGKDYVPGRQDLARASC